MGVVHPELLAERVANLADRAARAQRLAHRREEVGVATGGLAPLIAEASKYIDAIDETLTLDGLRIVYERVSI